MSTPAEASSSGPAWSPSPKASLSHLTVGYRELVCRSTQRRRLLGQHCLDGNSGRHRIEIVLLHQIIAIGEDRIGILHHLQPFVVVLEVHTHTGADDLVHI